jgi:hypothetical protein
VTRELNRRTETGSTSYALVNYDEVERVIPDIFKSRPKARLKKQIKSQIIYSYKKTVPSDAKLLRQTKRVVEPVKADIALRNDIAVFSTYAGKDSIGIVIEGPEIVGALRQLFQLAWDNQKNTDQ